MANNDIQGQVTDGGTGVSGATVCLVKSDGNDTLAKFDTTDSNGNYIFETHPRGTTGESTQWTVSAWYDDGSDKFTAETKPYISSQLPGDDNAFGVGGYDGSNSHDDNQVYSNNSWTLKQAYPLLAYGVNVGVDTNNGTIIASGGLSDSGSYENRAYEYDPLNDSWTQLNNMPNNSFRGASHTNFNGNVIVTGGVTEYDLGFVRTDAVNEWTGSSWNSLPSMPRVRRGHGIAKANGKIYVCGGQPNASKVDYWDGSSWTNIADLPNDCSEAAAGADANGNIRVIEDFSENEHVWDGSSWTTNTVSLNSNISNLNGAVSKNGDILVTAEQGSWVYSNGSWESTATLNDSIYNVGMAGYPK